MRFKPLTSLGLILSLSKDEASGSNLPLDLGEVRDLKRERADLGEQGQTVLAKAGVVRVHGDFVEEGVHRRAQFGERRHGSLEIL
jgi:hypothetical protein